MSPHTPIKQRIQSLDLLRGWAVIVMIQTHVFNGTLRQEILASPFFNYIQFIDGLVAPSFLFGAGMAFAVTTRRKIGGYLSFGHPLFRQIGRLLFIMLVGYGLHLPKFNYYHLRYEAGAAAWEVFWQVDVLQCIAVSLLLLQFLLLVLRSERRLYFAATVIAAAVVVATPLMWTIDFFTVFPVPFAEYINGLHHSLFPLFPWLAFLFAGAVTGYRFQLAREASAGVKGGEPAIRMTAEVGIASFALSFVLGTLSIGISGGGDPHGLSPGFFLERLGLVLLLCAGLAWWERVRSVSASSVVCLMGRESFLVYTVHLILIFGRFGGASFAERVNRTYGYLEAVAATLVLFSITYLLAYGWSRVKHAPPRLRRTVEGLIVAGFLLVFFFGPN
jgi:uncharacterized membrane protein